MARNQGAGNGTALHVCRIVQVLTLLPAWALLASVISNYNSHNQLTPSSIQYLFSICLILSVWSFCILITVLRARNTALWMTFFDIVGMAALIGGVVWLSNIANVECVTVNVTTHYQYNIPPNDPANNNMPSDLNPDEKYWNSPRRIMARFISDMALARRQTYTTNSDGQLVPQPLYIDQCGVIKAAWGLAIANIILFFISAILSIAIYKENQQRRTVVREKIIVDSPPVVPVVPHPAPVYQQEPSAYGRASTGSRRHSRSSRVSVGGRSGRHHHRRGSRAGPEYYV